MLGAPNNTIGQQIKPYKYQRVKFMYPSINYMGVPGGQMGKLDNHNTFIMAGKLFHKGWPRLMECLGRGKCSITLVGHTKI
jgi:hypothetical protein